ncbi:hypothetical protein V1477_003075 [Vespula maculifrons]
MKKLEDGGERDDRSISNLTPFVRQDLTNSGTAPPLFPSTTNYSYSDVVHFSRCRSLDKPRDLVMTVSRITNINS